MIVDFRIAILAFVESSEVVEIRADEAKFGGIVVELASENAAAAIIAAKLQVTSL